MDQKTIGNRFEGSILRRAVTTLKLPQTFDIQLAQDEVIVFAAADSNCIAFPFFVGWNTNATVSITSVIHLNYEAVDVERRSFDKGCK